MTLRLAPLTTIDLARDPRESLLVRLTPGEWDRLTALPVEKRREDWLLGRAAAKDAVRAALRRVGQTAPDWQAFEIVAGPTGAPRVHYLKEAGPPVALSLSHGHGRGAAWAVLPGDEGGLPGVDLELIRPRRLGTLRFYLHEDERAWVEALAGHTDDPPAADAEPTPRDVAAVVLWALKEAAFKALQPPRGTGLLDVALELERDVDGKVGTARVRYLGAAAERAATLGVREVQAGWRREGEDQEFVLAWAEALGGRLPGDAG